LRFFIGWSFKELNQTGFTPQIKKEDNVELSSFNNVTTELTVFPKHENYFLSLYSSETVSFFLPVALLFARTLRPLAVDILSRKPCLFFLFVFEG